MRILAHVNTKSVQLHGNMNPPESPALARKGRALSGTCAMPGGDVQLKVPVKGTEHNHPPGHCSFPDLRTSLFCSWSLSLLSSQPSASFISR